MTVSPTARMVSPWLWSEPGWAKHLASTGRPVQTPSLARL